MEQKYTHRIFEDSIDKLVHDKLVTQEMPFATTEWQALQQKLHPTKVTNNTWKLVLFGILFMLIGSLITYLFLNSNQTNTTIASQKTNEPITEKNTTKENTNTTTTLPLSAENVTTITTQKDVTNSTTENNTNTRNAIPTTTNTSIVNNNPSSYKKYESIKPSKSQTKIVKQRNTTTTKNKGTKVDDNTPMDNSTTDIATTIEPTTAITVEPNKITVTDNNENIDTKPTVPSTTLDTDTTNTQKVTSPPSSATAKLPLPKKVKTKKERAMPEHSFDDDRLFYVEAFSGMNNSSKNENSFAAFLAPNGYNAMRLNQETNLSSLTAGVNFKMRKKHFTISSGLTYLQMGDNINYDTTFNSNALVKTANGKTNFTYIEIPVLAGYEWANKRWGFSLQAGVSTGLLTQLSGSYVSINNFNSQLYNVKENKSTFRNTVFNAIIAPQVNYYFTSTSNLFIAPTYRRNLQSITNSNADLKQKYNVLGVQIGIRTRLK